MQTQEFLEKLRAAPRPVVVDFWAPWCGPCRMIGPALQRLEAQYEGQVDLWKINADESPEVLRSLRIFGIPTVIAFRDGQEVTRRTGAMPEAGLRDLFEAGLGHEVSTKSSIAPLERVLRAGSGAALLAFAYGQGWTWNGLLLGLIGGLIFFTAVYDRCPVWKAFTRWAASLKAKGSRPEGDSAPPAKTV